MALKKRDFIENNKLLPETTCCICGFLVDVNVSGEIKWLNSVVERQYLFLRNIYTIEDLKVMGIETVE